MVMTADDLKTRIGIIGALPLFSRCSAEDVERLAKAARPRDYDAGERLCVAGDKASECYVVAEGEAACTVGNVTVSVVGAHDVVGERGPITGRPRAATVTARSDMHVYAISREVITALIERNPEAASSMRDEVLRRYGD